MEESISGNGPSVRSVSAEQKQAIEFGRGEMELIAGPGSGKTFVLTNRIRYLIRSYGVDPGSILVITFTRAAALEMRGRFYGLMDGERPPVAFGTFHSVFYQMLRTCPEMKGCSLISDSEKMKVTAEMLKQADAGKMAEDTDQVMQVAGAVGRIKNEGILPWDGGGACAVMEEMSGMLPMEKFRKVYDGYNSYLQENSRIDFDDMLLRCRTKLETDECFLAKWQARFSYILIDEFQDICLLQYQIIKLLAAPQDNLFVVGDDDQSIYAFRGSRPEIMRNFTDDYEGAVRLTLSTNYRSDAVIVKTAGIMINDNKNRIRKDIKASRPEGQPVVYVSCRDRGDMLMKLADMLAGGNTGDCAVLCRKNRECRELADCLMRRGISFNIKEKLKDPMDSSTVKDLMNYLEFIYGRRSRDVMFRIMNRPVRYIKRDSVADEEVSQAGMIRYYEGNQRMQDTVNRFFACLDRLRQMKPFLAVNYIRKVEGYDRWAQEGLNAEKRQEYMENADAFQKKVKELGNLDSLKEYMDERRKQYEKPDSKEKDDIRSSGVRIMTYHGSKGLEFGSVFLPFMNEGEVPPKQSNTPEAIEEERRMVYVAATRAKDRLTVLYSESLQDTPSRFINRMIPEH